jgi:hemolysin activation/secretion protein
MDQKHSPSFVVSASAGVARALLLGCSLTTAGLALAQTPPDAGRLLDETRQPARPVLPPSATPKRLVEPPVRPTVDMPDGVTVTPSAFRIVGAASFPESELTALVQPFVGRKLDLAGLNEAAGMITRRYQAAGQLLSYAYLPAQRVADGVIEIAVLEGRIDAVQVANAQEVRLRDDVVQAHVGDLVDVKPLLQADVERRLLLLNDIPGVVARAAFTPGSSQGAAEVVVSVAEEEPLAADVRFDNHGSRSSGEYRAGVGLQFKDLFGAGDNTQTQFLVSNRGSLISGSVLTLVPVGGSGLKLGASLSSLRYLLGGGFQRLGAEGTANTLGLRGRYPIVRSQELNVNFEGSLERKRLHDDVQLPLTTTNRKTTDVATGTLSFDWRDSLLGAAVTAVSLSAAAGDLKLLTDPLRTNDAAGLRTAGTYKKGVFNLLRQQTLAGPLSASLRFGGQLSQHNLDSSEKLALGGPSGVRAYATGEAVVDDGRIGSAELRFAQDYLGGSLLWSLFYDQAQGRINVAPLANATGNEVRLAGTGVGLQWSEGDFGVSASLAWRSGRVPTAEGGDPSPRVYFQLFYTP